MCSTLRRGLSAAQPRKTKTATFRIEPFESAFRPGVDPMHLNKLTDDLETRRATEPRRE